MKPSEREEEYVVWIDFQKKIKLEGEKHKRHAENEKKRLKELHHMRCPKCGMDLVEIDYRNIKVDKCSEYEGIWLDAGELAAISKLEKTMLDKLFSVLIKSFLILYWGGGLPVPLFNFPVPLACVSSEPALEGC